MKDNVDEIFRWGEKLEEFEMRLGCLEDLVKVFCGIVVFYVLYL